MNGHIDLPQDTPKQEVIIQGKAFSFPADTIEGAPEGQELKVTPEVTNFLDENGRVITLKVVYKLSPPIVHPNTGQTIDSIQMGSFGQNDPVRMWMSSIFTADIVNMPEIITKKMSQAQYFYGPHGKIRLDEFLYTCLDAAFLGKPNAEYSGLNIHNAIKWKDLPSEVLNEIERRIKNNEPLNYMFLDQMLEEGVSESLSKSDLAPIIQQRAGEQFEQSTLHKLDLVTGKFSLESNDMYDFLVSSISIWDFEVEFEGNSILNGMITDGFRLTLDTNFHVISNNPGINFTVSLLNTILNRLIYYYSFSEKPYTEQRLPLICDRIRETIVTTIYNKLKEIDEQEVYPENKMADMTLGQFASYVYELRLNNLDHNMYAYRKRHDDSVPRMSRAEHELKSNES